MTIIQSNLFGSPRTGIRQIRIPLIDWSLVDTVLTFLAADALTRVSWASKKIALNFIFLLILGSILHRLAGLHIDFGRF